jgi:L-ribulokinase
MGAAPYPLHRKHEDPDFATQSPSDHMRALVEAVRLATSSAGIDGGSVAAIALDTTGSSVVPVDERLEPLDDYYLWCDHRISWQRAVSRCDAAFGPVCGGTPQYAETQRCRM